MISFGSCVGLFSLLENHTKMLISMKFVYMKTRSKVLVVESRACKQLEVPYGWNLGGMRKRIKVGLEMVMEPSVSKLDKLTSVLDSTYSRLLLRELTRKLLKG